MSPRRLRIGIDGREFTQQKTGIARIFGPAFKELCHLKPEWEFYLFGNQRTVSPFEEDHLTFIRLPERFTFWWDQVTLVRYLKREKVDLFLSPYYKVPLSSPCPVIPIIHDLIYLSSSRYRSPRYLFYRPLFRTMGYLYAHRSCMILTDSFYSQEVINRFLKVSKEKIRVIYPGIETIFKPLKAVSELERLEQKYHFRRPYLLYVGNFKPHKEVPFLIKAYRRLPDSLKEKYQLVLAGPLDNICGVPLKKRVEQEGLSRQVIFTDHVGKDLPFLYGGAALFLFASSDEGFGFPPLEAMACGIPVIATRSASLPEVIGEAGRLVPPGDAGVFSHAIEELLNDESARRLLVQRGFERVKHFTLEKQVKTLMQILEEVLKGGVKK